MATAVKTRARKLDARPDSLDFRDRMYEASLYEVPTEIELSAYQKWRVPILNQGTEGACTGFGLATVANYLLRRRKVVPDVTPVSARMLYEMAKRYDEWPGEAYDGSSARGAMKGWHKHGICSEGCWPYKPVKSNTGGLTQERTSDALKRPLGAYYRVNHKDLVSMHAAMAEVGALYATASVHEGWDHVTRTGDIPFTKKMLGGHAFALVAYDQAGFWIQNSWGPTWGKGGYARISYDDWLENGTDVWVARLGAPVTLVRAESYATAHSAAAGKSIAYSYSDLRPHIISIGNDGVLSPSGDYGTSENEVRAIFRDDFPRVTRNWKTKRLLLYAHGGLVPEATAVQRLADTRQALLDAEIYPITFIWHSDFWSTITNILHEALRRRKPEGVLTDAKDFMLDRLDDALEPLARVLTGKAQWDEMKENALLATTAKNGAARFALGEIAGLPQDDLEIHVAGHSAGSIFHAPLVRLLASKGAIRSGCLKGEKGYGLPIATCTLWAPACTVQLFKDEYMPILDAGAIERFALFTLTDKAERDDSCSDIYHKSLLYLVSDAFEEQPRIPLFRDGVPILGMEKFVDADDDLQKLFSKEGRDWVLAPNVNAPGSVTCSGAHSHGDFDDDKATLQATLARILGRKKAEQEFTIHRSASSLRDKRDRLQR
jgi:hypothetical protein